MSLPESNPSYRHMAEALREQINGEWNATVERLENEIVHLRAALSAHHDIATLSDEVLREYDYYRECPICRRARGE